MTCDANGPDCVAQWHIGTEHKALRPRQPVLEDNTRNPNGIQVTGNVVTRLVDDNTIIATTGDHN
jgi:hypothetical protein